jgi:broad specificity phosphatase PhoE
MPHRVNPRQEQMNRIYLVRHGEDVANVAAIFSCRHIDEPLTNRGVLQAKQTAAHLEDKQIDAVYSSPLLRAQQTAKFIASEIGCQVITLNELSEIDVGQLEGQPITVESWAHYNSIIAAWIGGKENHAFPSGEDHYAVQARVRGALQQMTLGSATLVVVGHVGLFVVLIGDLCNIADIPALVENPGGNCSISEIEFEWLENEPAAKLINLGMEDHLIGLE